jgi:orotidine-5'-phosphate decarboxylase
LRHEREAIAMIAIASPADRLIVALDYGQARPAMRMARQLIGLVRTVKVGSILFTACGPSIIQRLRALGLRIMLDLKFFDIPSMVEQSCRAAAQHGVSLLTVHASGPREMLEAAAAGARSEAEQLGRPRPAVVGVTVLTSVGGASPSVMTRRVVALAQRAQAGGLDGVVASAQEAAAIRRSLGNRALIVCPGIRMDADARDDQRRVSGPRNAIEQGADLLVVGRPITAAQDPRAAARGILEQLSHGKPGRVRR